MEMCHICVYYGEGRGKTAAAFGNALLSIGNGNSAIIIQFLKSKMDADLGIYERLEPEMKLFRFEKHDEQFEELSESEKEEEVQNIHNGLHFARKVLSTGECDLLILDEILGILDYGIISVEDVIELLSHASSKVDVILTGRKLIPGISEIADELYEIQSSADKIYF